jgi:Response regulator of the LytR/AlgR family
MNAINVILIEDEPLIRSKIESIIKNISTLELAGVFENPIQALEILKNKNIDLILSDIQMPEMDGISFLRSLEAPPFVIFITAHSEYATEGFELEVLDYIMKPVTEERLLKGVEKVKKALQYKRNNQVKSDYIRIKDRNKTAFLKPSDILYVQGWGDYVKIFTNDGVTTLTYSMKEMEKVLPWKYFIRIQRSYIVNTEYIKSVDATKVFLKHNMETLPIGLQYRKDFYLRMGIEN